MPYTGAIKFWKVSVMKQNQLANWLRSITIFASVLGVVFIFYLVPYIGKSFVHNYPEFSYVYWPYVLWAGAVVIPCYLALYQLWKICGEIARDNSFSHANAKALHTISGLAFFDTLLMFLVSIVFFFLNMIHPALLACALLISVFGLSIALVSAVLSHWVEKGCSLKEENDLTI